MTEPASRDDPYRDGPCRDDQRRSTTRRSSLLGLDYVEVDPTQTVLDVYFLGEAPQRLTRDQVAITGGRAVQVLGIKVYRRKDPTLDDWFQITVDRPGDFSVYTLSLTGPGGTIPDGFDPRYASVRFSFKASCRTGLDCKPMPVCPPVARPAPPIDYLAKDYASFRQAMLDRLAVTIPGWQETHAPDIGVMLVELLAYVGDQLSYYQDAVATEAYLGTARHRISLRRHARLVDYAVHEGCNARAFVQIETNQDTVLAPRSYFFSTALPGAAPGLSSLDVFRAGGGEPFEPLLPGPDAALALSLARNEIRFYTWGERDCCLPRGTTSATLRDAWAGPSSDRGPDKGTARETARRTAREMARASERPRALGLEPGDFLLLEEVRGPRTGNPADADPTHRTVVRLTEVNAAVDPLFDAENGGVPVLEVVWCSEDALTFPLCISARTQAPGCAWHEDVSVARGNVVLVDHGLSLHEPLDGVPVRQTVEICATDCAPASVSTRPGPFGPQLGSAPLTWAQALPACGCASALLAQDPRAARPQVVLSVDGGGSDVWRPKPDLLESGPEDRAFVVETDDQGSAHLRFGDGVNGAAPAAGTAFAASYRIGNGPAGNVGAETIVQLVRVGVEDSGLVLRPRNPLPSAGGTGPEPLEEVRQFAPFAFRDKLERAVTAADYAAIAGDDARRRQARATLGHAAPPTIEPWRTDGDPRRFEDEEPGAVAPLPDLCRVPFRRLQGARAAASWTGSWYEMRIALDPLGSDDPAAAPCAEVAAWLERYRRIGHDLRVEPPRYVALDVGLRVCVAPQYQRGHMEAALRAALGPRRLPNGALGLFHPDNLTFAEAVHASRIVAAAQAIAGVIEVRLVRLARFVPGTRAPGRHVDQVPTNGTLDLGAFEIARLDDDPSRPGLGRLTLLMRGGR